MAALLAALVCACTAGKVERVENVRPPRAGTPGRPAEVQGIYRSLHQALLQLRGDGSVVLVVPGGGGPSSGRFTLQEGRLEVQTSACGDAVGSYDMVVTGEQAAGKAMLRISVVSDDCATRRQDLTRDPWVYANS
jgi:hypothetical protein